MKCKGELNELFKEVRDFHIEITKNASRDSDNFSAMDLIVTQENAAPVLLRNVGANKNHFVRLDLPAWPTTRPRWA